MHPFQRLFNWFFSKKYMPYWCIFLIDCAIVALSSFITILVVSGPLFFAERFAAIMLGAVICLTVFALSFHIFRTYAGIVRYSSFVDLQKVFAACVCASASFCLVGFVTDILFPGQTLLVFPTLVQTIMLCLLSTFFMWTERIVVKRFFDLFNIKGAKSVAIYGTKEGGISLAKSLTAVKNKKYVLHSFISDGKEMKGVFVVGKPVYLNESGVAARLKSEGVQVLYVSPLKIDKFRNNQAMIDEFIAQGIKIMMFREPWDGMSMPQASSLREIEVEDLLPRDKIEVDMKSIGDFISGRRVLITGAAGSIGSEMVRQVAALSPSEMVLIDQAETAMHDIRRMMAAQFPDVRNLTIVTSITNAGHMERIFSEHRPEYVFHAAAYKHVPMMEDDPAIAVQNNIYGTRVIADLAVKYGTMKFVMISTDKAVNPTNVMGCSKRICEIYCQSLNRAIQEGKVRGVTQFVTTRFGNVLGSNGSVIPIFRKQIKEGGPVTVTHPKIVRFFMLIPEACQLVLEAGTMGKGGEIFVFDMGKPVRIVDLAKRMIALSGASDIGIRFIGLRDGEKLYEEVLNDMEGTLPTVHPKIKVAKVREYDYFTACGKEERLMEVSRTFDDMEIVKVMKEIVPEYKSRHSKYEALDA